MLKIQRYKIFINNQNSLSLYFIITMKKIELLSPAKDLVTGLAAFDFGADAVYIGGPSFGAREKAVNTIADIAKLCDHAALFGGKVYVTLNTLLHDSELDEAQRIVEECYDAGVDALIVQDMSLLRLDLPPIALHASTQCHNTTPEKVRFLEKCGFSQVVLARELTLEQIREIHAATEVPLEFFIHGALCVSYSGQCYLSHFLGNRSANRGACAQPCRLPWTLYDNKGKIIAKDKHLLSLKDLNNSHNLEELINAGISSFKIEGRMKDVDYVKNITAYYRTLLDEILSRRNDLQPASQGHCSFSFVPNPEIAFNRGFTDHFIHGRQKNIFEPRTPKNKGQLLGKVTHVNHNSLIINTSQELHSGDGLCYFDEHEELKGFLINEANGGCVTPNEMPRIAVGTEIYRNFHRLWEKEISQAKGNRKIDISLELSDNDEGLIFIAYLPDNQQVSISYKTEKILANNTLKATENTLKKISQWGDTIFNIIDIKLNCSQVYFIPTSILGEMKRLLLQRLTQHLITQHHDNRECRRQEEKDFPYPSKTLDFRGNVINEKAKIFYQDHGVDDIAWGAEKEQPPGQVALMTCRHCLRFAFGLCSKVTGDASPLVLENDKGRFQLTFDCQRCEMSVKQAYQDSSR